MIFRNVKLSLTKQENQSMRLQGKVASFLILLVVLALLTSIAQTQTRTKKWLFAASSRERVKQYYRNDVRKIDANRYRAWAKILFPDESYILDYAIWDCKSSVTKTTKSLEYDSDGRLVDQSNGSGWKVIVPDSLGETVALRICGIRKNNTWIEIITKNANLRSFNTRYSAVLRIAPKGQRFRVISYKPNHTWFNVIDEKTQEDYWVHRTTVKVLAVKAGRKRNSK